MIHYHRRQVGGQYLFSAIVRANLNLGRLLGSSQSHGSSGWIFSPGMSAFVQTWSLTTIAWPQLLLACSL